MDYIIVIHAAEHGGYWAEVQALPGCFAQGETFDDLLGDVRGAIASHLEALRDDGQPVPDGDLIVASVRIPEPAVRFWLRASHSRQGNVLQGDRKLHATLLAQG